MPLADAPITPEEKYGSTPYLCGFDPYVIPYQADVVNLIRHEFDYSLGNLEIMLSGSYGSAKSILMAHLAVTHCLMFKGARVCLGRRAMPDLKRTILKEVLDHISEDLIEGVDYKYNRSESTIVFLDENGDHFSEIISISWSDKRYNKGRSLKLSMLIIEELTENTEEDFEAVKTLKARLRRIPSVPENVLICATNPDAPTHFGYRYFIEPNLGNLNHPTRFVFYSLTEQNPFLDAIYILQLRKDLSPKEIKRYLEGQWIELYHEVIYGAYRKEINYIDEKYKINMNYPLKISFDFNIGDGKPFSVCLLQIIDDVVHVAGEVVIEGMRTSQMMDEIAERGLLDFDIEYEINGDATGKARDTKSIWNDYEIIEKFLANYINKAGKQLNFKLNIAKSNPPLKKRHNIVNGYCYNDLGEVRLFVYKSAQTVDKGLRLTRLKKNGSYIEDDGKAHPWQHITTALGYAILFYYNIKNTAKQESHQN